MENSKKNIPFILFLLSFATTIAFYGLEAITFQGVIQKYFNLNPALPALLTFFALVNLRLHKSFPQRLPLLLFFLATKAILLTAIGLLLDLIIHANFVYSTFHINPLALIPLSLFLLVYSVITFTPSFIHRNSPLLLFITPVFLFTLAFFLRIQNQNTFYELTKEDSLIEYTTMIVYLIIAFYGYKSLKLILHSSTPNFWAKRISMTVYLILIFASLFIAGEEISWGQRIIGFATPDGLREYNTQSEFNLHNTGDVFGHVYTAYALLALYGSTAWFLQRTLGTFIQNNTLLSLFRFFSPPLLTASFFLPMLIFVPSRAYFFSAEAFDVTYFFTQWEEFIELILSLGIVLFIYLNFQKLIKNRSSLSHILE